MKLMEYNKPYLFIFTGVLFSFFAGLNMPFFGVILSKLLSYMTAPMEYLRVMDATWTGTGEAYLEQQVNFYCIIMAFVAVWCAICSFI